MSAPRENRPEYGFLLGCAAFFCFAWTDTSAKILVGLGLPVLVIAFARYAVNFILVVGYFLPVEGTKALKSNVVAIQVMRGFSLLGGTVLNFWALKYLPLTTTIPIFFAVPLVVCLLSAPMLGEKVGIRRYAAVIVGFLGVLIIIRPGGIVFHWAMLISCGATVMASLYFIFTRMIAGRDDMPVSQIYASGIATLVLLPFALLYWETPATAWAWFWLILAGTTATIGHCLLTIGYRFAQASVMAPVVYSSILYITVISWVLFGQLPDGWTIVGTAVIIGSGLYIWWRERDLSAPRHRTGTGG